MVKTKEEKREARRRWRKNNPEKTRKQKREQRIRYSKNNPEKARAAKRNYLDRKLRKRIKANPKYLDKLKGKLLGDFNRLTRLMFKDKLPKECDILPRLKSWASNDMVVQTLSHIVPASTTEHATDLLCCGGSISTGVEISVSPTVSLR